MTAPKDDVSKETTVRQVFERLIKEHPDRWAVKTGGGMITVGPADLRTAKEIGSTKYAILEVATLASCAAHHCGEGQGVEARASRCGQAVARSLPAQEAAGARLYGTQFVSPETRSAWEASRAHFRSECATGSRALRRRLQAIFSPNGLRTAPQEVAAPNVTLRIDSALSNSGFVAALL